jgi:uncharacterized protein YndB with AHSA1/START domain
MEFIVETQISIAAPIGAVFDALTDPAQIVQYYPLASVYSERCVGGAFVCVGSVEGVTFTDYGIIEILGSPYRFRYNYWSDNHGTPDKAENRMIIDYQLYGDANGTELKLSHINLLTAERHGTMAKTWGWLLGRLKRHVETVV